MLVAYVFQILVKFDLLSPNLSGTAAVRVSVYEHNDAMRQEHVHTSWID